MYRFAFMQHVFVFLFFLNNSKNKSIDLLTDLITLLIHSGHCEKSVSSCCFGGDGKQNNSKSLLIFRPGQYRYKQQNKLVNKYVKISKNNCERSFAIREREREVNKRQHNSTEVQISLTYKGNTNQDKNINQGNRAKTKRNSTLRSCMVHNKRTLEARVCSKHKRLYQEERPKSQIFGHQLVYRYDLSVSQLTSEMFIRVFILYHLYSLKSFELLIRRLCCISGRAV